jgi:hypothetical protein
MMQEVTDPDLLARLNGDSDSLVDPRLKQQLNSTKDPKQRAILQGEVARQQSGKHDWSDPETHRRLEVTDPDLLARLNSDSPKATDEVTDPDLLARLNEDEPVEKPSWIGHVGQGLADAVGMVGGSVPHLAAGFTDLLSNPISKAVFGDSTQYTDKLRDIGEKVYDATDTLVLSKEEQEQHGPEFWDKVGRNVSGVVPFLALKRMASPAIVGPAVFSAGRQAIKAGEEPDRATAIGALQGLGTAAGVGLPAAGVSVPQTAALVVGGGPVLGGITDALSREIATTESLKAGYDPFDAANRFSDLLFAGAAGIQSHVRPDASLRQKRTKAEYKKWINENPEKYQESVRKVTENFSEQLTKHQIADYRVTPDETPEAAVTRMLDTIRDEEALRQTMEDDPNSRPVNVPLSGLLKALYDSNPDFDSKVRIKHIMDQAMELGMDKTDVLKLTDFETGNPNLRGAGPTAAGAYQYGRDRILFNSSNQKLAERADQIDILLHETVHALNAGLDQTRSVILEKLKTEEGKSNLTAGEKKLMATGFLEPAHRVDEVIEMVKSKLRSANIPYEDVDPLNPGVTRLKDEWYGLKNRMEFLAELFRGSKEGSLLHNLNKLNATGDEVREYKKRAGLDLDLNHKYQELARVMRASDSPIMGNMADLAIHSYFNYVQRNSLDMRAQRAGLIKDGFDEAGKEARRYVHREDVTDRAVRNQEDESRMAAEANADPTQRYLTEAMYDALHNASSFEEFKSKAKLWDTDPIFLQWLEKDGRALFDHSQFLPRVMEEISGYSSLPENLRLMVRDNRTVPKFMDDLLKTMKPEDLKKDMSAWGTNFLNPATMRLMKKDGLTGKILKFFLDKGDIYNAYGEIKYQEMKEMIKDYDALDHKKKVQAFGFISSWDTPMFANRLKRMGLQWPSDQMMRHHGMDDEQVKAIKGIQEASDVAYDLANQMYMKRNNGKQLERQPGYIPHFHDGGPYKVFLKHAEHDFIVRVRGFSRRGPAMRWAAKMQQEGFRLDVDPTTKSPVRINKYQDVGETLMQSYQSHNLLHANLQKLGPAYVAEIQRLDDSYMKDFGKNLLERSDVAGFTGEFGAEPNAHWTVMNKIRYHLFHDSPAFQIHDRYFKTIADTWKNEMFLDDVYHPLMNYDAGYMTGNIYHGEIFNELKNVRDYLTRYTANFVGKNINKFHPVDNFLRDASITLGLNPHMYRKFARDARNFLSLVKLRVNPANYWNNAVQPVHMMSWLMYSDAMMGVSGEPLKAFSKVLQKGYNPDADMHAALRWARHDRVLAPQFDAELTTKANTRFGKVVHALTLGGVNPAVEQFGRQVSFMIAFEHYKKVYGGDVVRAREAAAKATTSVMVNYDRSNRPLMYQDFGIIGELASPFAVFRNAYFGNTLLMTRGMLKAVKDNPKNLRYFTPWLMSQATYLMMAGALGMVGVGEYNMVADAVNEVSGEEIMPKAEDFMFRKEWDDGIIFGGPSVALKKVPGLEGGAYVGGSGSAVGVDDLTSSAMLPFLKALTSLAGLTYKGVRSTITDAAPPTMSDAYKAGRQFIPGVFMNEYESLFTGEESGVALKSSAVEAATERTAEGKAAVRVTGRQDLDEFRRRSNERAVDRHFSLEKKQLAQLVEGAADAAEGKPTLWTQEKIQRRARELGLSQRDLTNRIVQEIERRRIPSRTRDARNAASGNESAARRMNYRQELQGER